MIRFAWDDTLPVSTRVESLLRDAELFESWLEDWGPGMIVGYARSDASCPLARFLSELVGAEVEVGVQGAYTEGGRVSLPGWAERFVAAVDGTAPQMPPSPVTADEARRYLGVALSQLPQG